MFFSNFVFPTKFDTENVYECWPGVLSKSMSSKNIREWYKFFKNDQRKSIVPVLMSFGDLVYHKFILDGHIVNKKYSLTVLTSLCKIILRNGRNYEIPIRHS